MCLTAAAEEANLIANGGFETLDASGNPEGWYPTAYRTQEGYSRIAITSEKAHSGQYSAVVENASANDARYTCTVAVEPSSLYRLSAYVLVESMEDTGNGANLGMRAFTRIPTACSTPVVNGAIWNGTAKPARTSAK